MSIQNQFNEAETRYNLVDPLVKKAGWDLACCRSVGLEIPEDGYDASPVNSITSYYLFRDKSEIPADFEEVRIEPDARTVNDQ